MTFCSYRLASCVLCMTLPLVILSSSQITFAQTQLPSRVAPRNGFIGKYNAYAPFTLLGNDGIQIELELADEQKSQIAKLKLLSCLESCFR